MNKYIYIALIVVIFVVLFVAVHMLFPLNMVNAIFDNFNKFALGVSALIASFAGSLYFIDQFQRKRLIDTYRKQYSLNKYGTNWKIIVREDRTGEPHVLDIHKKTKHHIWNMKTIYDLGWQFYDRESVRKDEFDKYKTGDPIRTRGDLGE